METVSTTPTTTEIPARRWPWFLLGVVLFFLGPVIYAVEVNSGRLAMPWYLLGLATAGIVFMAISTWQRRGILRSVGLLFFLILWGGSWFFMAVASKTPQYAGPALPGNKLPEFTAKLADGKPFTHSDLAAGKRSGLVFNRGRW